MLLNKPNFPGKPGRARNKVHLEKKTLDTILSLIRVYIVITLLLVLFQRVYICARPVISTTAVTQIQFSRKIRKSKEQIVFAEIKP